MIGRHRKTRRAQQQRARIETRQRADEDNRKAREIIAAAWDGWLTVGEYTERGITDIEIYLGAGTA
jgi:hypothetical protein